MKEYFLVAEFSSDEAGGVSCIELDLETGGLQKIGFVNIPYVNEIAISDNGSVAGSLRYFSGSEGEGGAATITENTVNSWSTHGMIPCYATWGPDSCWIFSTNYISGSVCCHNTKTGEEQMIRHVGYGTHPRQDKPHPHHAMVTQNGKWLLITDLGMNEVVRYPFSKEKGVDVERALHIALPEALGPRHLALVDDRMAYVVGELNPGVAVLDIEQGIFLSHILFPNLPEGSTGAAIKVAPDQKLLVATLRTADMLALCKISAQGCELMDIVSSEGEKPMDICFSKDGKWMLCANENSCEVLSFAVSENRLSKTASLQCVHPMAVRYLRPQEAFTQWKMKKHTEKEREVML